MTQQMDARLKAVYTIIERQDGFTRWVRIGIGFRNSDGSVNVKLDAIPVNGRLHIRNHIPREDRDRDAPKLSRETLNQPLNIEENPKGSLKNDDSWKQS